MTNKEIKIAYTEYASLDELSAEDRVLAEAAIEAVATSYAPYSNFNVGAAVRFNDGEIIRGSNQENAAYPSGMCAERTALFYASASRPGVPMNALAIAAAQNGELLIPDGSGALINFNNGKNHNDIIFYNNKIYGIGNNELDYINGSRAYRCYWNPLGWSY